MKKVSLFVLAVIMLFVFAGAIGPSIMATATDDDSSGIPSGVSTSSEPVRDNVIPTTTIVEPSTAKIEPLKIAAAPAESTTPAPSLPYIPIIAGFAVLTAAIFVILNFKRRGHKFSRLRLLSSLALLGLLMISVGQVYGEETLTVSCWDLTGVVCLPLITRESVDSAGNVWLGSWGSNRIGRLNPSANEVKIWITPEAVSITSVSVDQADKVWFVDTSLERVGQFNPSTNFFTIWPVLGIGSAGISALPTVSIDSYGNAYFPEYYNNKIGRINPVTNELTEWIIPTDDSYPCYTMVDANNNVWFAEQSGNKIGRLNPFTNEMTEWAIPTPNSRPSGLYVSGGLVYFTEEVGSKIGRLNPSTNEITQWSLSWFRTGGGYHGMFVDSDGNAWFTYSSAYLFRLGTDNIFTYWGGIYAYTYGVTVDTKVNVGDVYVTSWYSAVSGYLHLIYRFRPAKP